MISGPGRRLGHAEAVEHLAGGNPHVGFCRGLSDVGEHGVGAAEGDDGHLAEEDGKPREHLIRAKRQQEQSDRHEPEHEEDRRDPKRAMTAGMRRQAGSESRVGIGQARSTLAAMPTGPEYLGPAAADEIADEASAEHDEREWHTKEKDRHEGSGGHRDCRPTAKRA